MFTKIDKALVAGFIVFLNLFAVQAGWWSMPTAQEANLIEFLTWLLGGSAATGLVVWLVPNKQ